MNWIRPWTLEDASDIASALNNPNIRRNLRDGLPLPYTPEDGREYIQSVLDAPAGSQYAWAIQIEGKAVGSIGIFRQQNIHSRTGELGYYLAEPYWGRGIVTNAVKEACGFVFRHTDIIRVFAEPFSHNKGSCRVLEKAGFSREGILRSNAVKDGTIVDMTMYALVK